MHAIFDSAPTTRKINGRNGPMELRQQVGGLVFPGQLIPLIFTATLPDDTSPYLTDGTKYGVNRDHFRVGDYGRLQFNDRAPFTPLEENKDAKPLASVSK